MSLFRRQTVIRPGGPQREPFWGPTPIKGIILMVLIGLFMSRQKNHWPELHDYIGPLAYIFTVD